MLNDFVMGMSRGIDAPENSMPYGKEAKEELAMLVQGKCLRVQIGRASCRERV